jgi:molybdopterin synthase catalytic subunit
MIRVQKENFDISKELKKLSYNKNVGGISFFIGLVRENLSKDKCHSMTLQHYPEMTKKMLNQIENEANKRWNLIDSIIIHRYGKLYPGDQIVLVGTSSEHRKEAITSCEFLIDWLKTKAPFWKLEERESGKKWVEENRKDLENVKNWE